jgi:hypothetical protein
MLSKWLNANSLTSEISEYGMPSFGVLIALSRKFKGTLEPIFQQIIPPEDTVGG